MLYLVLPGFVEIYWVLLRVTEFYRVNKSTWPRGKLFRSANRKIASFFSCVTEFYWVLPISTGFYLVLSRFTVFYRVSTTTWSRGNLFDRLIVKLHRYFVFYRVLLDFITFHQVLLGFT